MQIDVSNTSGRLTVLYDHCQFRNQRSQTSTQFFVLPNGRDRVAAFVRWLTLSHGNWMHKAKPSTGMFLIY